MVTSEVKQMETILTKHFEIRSHIYELLLDLALFTRAVISVPNGNLNHSDTLRLKYPFGCGRFILPKYKRALDFLQTHNVSYTSGNYAPRGLDIGYYIDVLESDLCDLILTLKNSVMLTVDQWSTLRLNDRRNYILSMCTMGALASRDAKQLSYARHLLDDDCDAIAERAMHNPIESKIYFKR